MNKKFKFIITLFVIILCASLMGCNLINPDETIKQIELQNIINDINRLEVISKNYNVENFNDRVLIYIRCKRYSTNQWNLLGGTLETDFESYVTTNQNGIDLSYLQTKEFFVDPITMKNIDFIHMFATMNLQLKNEMYGDLGGFGGDICQLVSDLSILDIDNENDLINEAKTKFNGISSFGYEDVLADIDAVNIINVYNDLQNDKKLISKSIETYYSNLSQKKRLSSFSNYLFGNTNLSAEDKCENVLNRLKSNILITKLCQTYNIDFEQNEKEFNICINLFVNYITNI